MEQDIKTLKKNVDGWIKTINQKQQTLLDNSSKIDENISNTEHNYEIICELKEDVDRLKIDTDIIKVLLTKLLMGDLKAKISKKK